MKMLITVEGRQYEVQVQVLEESASEHWPLRHPRAGERSVEPPPSDSGAEPPPRPVHTRPAPPSGAQKQTEVKSPAAGNVVSVRVKQGDPVQANDPLMVIEAMKMESSIVSPMTGTIDQVLVKPGDAVAADQVVMRFQARE